MAELARGAVTDRPWGRTLAALGLRGLTGQLTLASDGKRYQIAFEGGAVVAAVSPLASDAAVRVALTGGLISSTQVADLARRQAAAPGRDEIELLSELLRLAPEQSMRLRRRTVAQRAARTFSIDRGEFVIEDAVSIAVVPGSELDIRSVIYLGARLNLSEARLSADLALLGAWFRLQPSALEDLPQFGFTEAERPVLEQLRGGATLEELEAAGAEPRVSRALVYALVSCGACEIGGAGRAFEATGKKPARPATRPPPLSNPASAPPPSLRGDAGSSPGIRRPTGASPPGSASGGSASGVIAVPAGGSASGVIAVPAGGSASGPSSAPGASAAAAGPAGRRLAIAPPRARRAADTAQVADVRALIAQRMRLLDQGADHFQLLGVSQGASAEEVRTSYFALARQLHPDRLAALGIDDGARDAQRVFAQVNTAFAVLSDKRRRDEYSSVLRRGGEAVVRAEQAKAEALAMRIIESEDAFQRAEAALRRDQLAQAIAELQRAIELNPDESDYHATLAWAQFCAAHDKALVAPATRATLERALAASPKAISPRFFLGRVERMLGRDADALRHFQEVLRRNPNHAEAASEVRVIEQRLAGSRRR